MFNIMHSLPIVTEDVMPLYTVFFYFFPPVGELLSILFES